MKNEMKDETPTETSGASPKNQLKDLNPVQQQAVLHLDSPLLLIAGAGSGKTKVITNKIAYLIKEKNFSSRNILGVTFTNKAAQEMRERIESLTDIESRRFNIFTFHALGLRILRESGAAAGFDDQWQVIDDNDQKRFMEKIIKDNFSHFTRDMRDDIRRKIGFAKMELTYPNNKEYLYQIGFNEEEVKIFSLYYQFQKEKKVWDYEDLVSFPVKILQNNEDEREKYASRFRYVVVDEFQDTNPNQYELLRLIAGKHKQVTVVGDDDQAIYSWRGANIRFLREFENDFPGARTIKMEQNYRSTPQVLDFANDLIRSNRARRDKSMWTEQNSGNPVFVLETRSKEDEARQVADLVQRLQTSRDDLFPIAILYRINSQSLALETEFNRRNINYKVLKGLRFFERKEIKDSLALLKLAYNLNDDISFLRLIDCLPLGIGARSLEELTRRSQDEELSLFATLREHAPDKFRARELFGVLYDLNHQKDELKVSDILKTLLSRSGYLDSLQSREEKNRTLNIDELTGFVENWEKTSPNETFHDLMDRINLDGGASKEDKNESPVFLLTMHNAKGLEFPTVVSVGTNPTFLPFFMRKSQADIEEERRLFYVSSTRAIKQLVVSVGSEKRSIFLGSIKNSLYSTVYSMEEMMMQLSGGVGNSRERLKNLLGQATGVERERYLEHPIFGRGKVIETLSATKYMVHFVKKGKEPKVIDTSIVPVTFL